MYSLEVVLPMTRKRFTEQQRVVLGEISQLFETYDGERFLLGQWVSNRSWAVRTDQNFRYWHIGEFEDTNLGPAEKERMNRVLSMFSQPEPVVGSAEVQGYGVFATFDQMTLADGRGCLVPSFHRRAVDTLFPDGQWMIGTSSLGYPVPHVLRDGEIVAVVMPCLKSASARVSTATGTWLTRAEALTRRAWSCA